MQNSLRCGLSRWLVAVAFVFPMISSAKEREDVQAWSRQFAKARAAVGSATNEADALKVRQAQWKELAAGFPVFTDWLLQDAGREAELLLVTAQSAAIEQKVLTKVSADVTRLGGKISDAANVDVLTRYAEFATERRSCRISGLLRTHAPFAFTEGHTFRMSFIGYTEGLSDARNERFFRPGARLATLEFPRGELFGVKRTLLDDPHGMIRDVDVSFDRERLLFAWKKSDRLDDYHLHEWRLRDGKLRQLTTGLGRADYEPIYLPDGDILFTSTRPEQSVPCWWTEISNLYRMDGEGRHVRRLAVDQVHALYPQLMADGRVTYTRWDYNDRGQVYPHPVFSMRPDGQDQRAFYGANSWFPNSLLHTRGIPGSHKAMSIAAGHHTLQQGKLVILDQLKDRDEGPGMEFIAPRRVVPYERKDQAMQQGDLFRYPYPLSETELLVSYKPEWGVERFGFYWMNADGERELLHADPVLDVARMVALGQPRQVARIADEVDYTKTNGTYYVHDVYRGIGLEGIARGTAKKIRVVELDYRAAGVGRTMNSGEGGGSLNSSPVALGNASWDVKRILGDADIHADGSALFEVPAMASIYLQVLDAKGRVIQTTRTWDTLRPGERKGCMGCHDKSVGNFYPYKKEDTIAWRNPPQKLQPFHGAPRGFSFAKEVQPILDAKCVRCHDGSKPDAMDLRGVVADATNLNLRAWTKSYLNLTEAVRKKDGNYVKDVTEEGLVSWISKMSRPSEIPPYFAGSAKSRLLALLEKGHHDATLSAAEYETLAAWMDLLVPFSGDYREGNTWTAPQMAYYDYYEGKRRAQAAEERAAVAAYIAHAATNPTDEVAAFTRARYRSVIEKLPAAMLSKSAPAIVDRLWIRAAPDQAGRMLKIINSKNGKSVASLRFSPQVGATEIVLVEPIRTDSLQIEADGGEPVTGLEIERALGVLVSEVPMINGFHPVLDVSNP